MEILWYVSNKSLMVPGIVANIGDILAVWFIILPFVSEKKTDIPIVKKNLWAEKKLAPKKTSSTVKERGPEIDALIEV